MSFSQPWVTDILSEALRLYYSNSVNPRYEYKRDNSNLTIIIRGTHDLRLCLLGHKSTKFGKLIVAQATDGQIAIQTSFSREALLPEQPTDANLEPHRLSLGTILKPRLLEVRLAHHRNPPQVTLFLRTFDILGADDTVKTDKWPDVYQDSTVTTYLEILKRSEEERMMIKPRDSPSEIRSQVGDLEDGESDNEPQFATQLPPRHTPRISGDRTGPSKISKNTQFRQPSEKNSYQAKHNLLNVLHKSVIENTTDAHMNDLATSTAPDLTQQEIIVPPSVVPNGGHDDKDGDGDGDVNMDVANLQTNEQEATNSTTQAVDAMPNAILQLMRHWRKECHADRYIPRRLQIIPKDQAKILDSDDCWQPSLPGHTNRPGTVPVALLDQLTRAADSEHVQALPKVKEVKIYDCSQHDSPDEHEQEKHDELREEPKEHQYRVTTPSQSDSEDSGEVEWSPSPKRHPKGKLLPPDSSPLRPNESHNTVSQGLVTIRSEKNSGRATDQDPLPFDASVSNDLPRASNTENNVNEINGIYSSCNSKAARSRDNGILPTPSNVRSSQTYIPPGTTPRVIHVKRTPFLSKGLSSPRSVPESSTNFVPGTFDERRIPRQPDVGNGSRRSATVAYGVVSKPNTNTTEFETLQTSEVDEQDDHPADNCELPKLPTLEKKRRMVDEQSSFRKRSRKTPSTVKAPKSTDPDYRFVDEDLAQYRRECFTKIGHKRHSVKPARGSVDRPQPQTIESHDQGPTRREADMPDSSSISQRDRLETSDTHLSVHQDARRTDMTVVINGIGSTVLSELAPIGTSNLYTAFTSAYPRYGGRQEYFIATCQLLKKLHSESKAPHQSLWDDFVFRNFHDYRDHLRDVFENCGSALPYEVFYNERIEQPICLSHIINKTTLLHNVHTDPVSVTKHQISSVADTAPSASIVAQPVEPINTITIPDKEVVVDVEHVAADRSVAAESSVSNIKVLKEPQPYEQKSISPPVRTSRPIITSQTPQTNQQNLSQEKSQDSRTSVNVWLERTAGAESPILGTPDVVEPVEAEVPALELNENQVQLPSLPKQQTTQLAQKKKKRRSLPWGPSSGGITQHDTDIEPARSDPVAISSPPIQQKTTNPLPSLRKKLPTTIPASQEHAAPKSKRNAKLPIRSSQADSEVETNYTRFVRLYNELQTEKPVTKDKQPRATWLMDISSWRR